MNSVKPTDLLTVQIACYKQQIEKYLVVFKLCMSAEGSDKNTPLSNIACNVTGFHAWAEAQFSSRFFAVYCFEKR